MLSQANMQVCLPKFPYQPFGVASKSLFRPKASETRKPLQTCSVQTWSLLEIGGKERERERARERFFVLVQKYALSERESQICTCAKTCFAWNFWQEERKREREKDVFILVQKYTLSERENQTCTSVFLRLDKFILTLKLSVSTVRQVRLYSKIFRCHDQINSRLLQYFSLLRLYVHVHP